MNRVVGWLTDVYSLRTLQWGALTRVWPRAGFSVWQEDADAEGGYKLIWTGGARLPSNPEVEAMYDITNGDKKELKAGGMLDQFGDFVQGMMRLKISFHIMFSYRHWMFIH